MGNGTREHGAMRNPVEPTGLMQETLQKRLSHKDISESEHARLVDT